ncbi:hydroxyisourate hydrolase [Paenibacillus thailandensis]|uniref:5-hydroxyisourate hydrolase n=1 Tax=Paenibacillus thailandensis TaxID=393250 RepID=A0ABW5R3P5_9BACL
MNGKLTTHVLDTSIGRPAEGMGIELWGIEGDSRLLLGTAVTNADGRVDAPLLQGDELREGMYELVFAAEDYFRGQKVPDDRLIFDRIPIRFRVKDVTAHYHIPLLAAPGGYSTYRGS